MNDMQTRAQWRSFSSYVAVTTGAVVGLGNVFQFPFLVTKYGALFLIFYFLCELMIALPLLFSELLIGRRGKQNPVGSIDILAMESGANPRWDLLGWWCVFVGFVTMGYYTVSAAFPVGYLIDNIKTLMSSTNSLSSALQLDTTAMSSFSNVEICFVIALLLAMLVVCRGINRGLEAISLIVIPFYCIALFLLACYISTQGYFGATIQSLFALHSDIRVFEIFLAALALGFLKYGTGMGVMIVYGSYLPYHVPLAKSTLVVVAIDAFVSLVSYFIIYPLTLSSSPEGSLLALHSHNVITIFSAIPHGLFISALFFFVVILVAWMPIIAMAETIVVTLMERLYWSRAFATIMSLLAVFLLGTFVVGTRTAWTDITIFSHYQLFDMVKRIAMNYLTLIAALFIALFAGWVVRRHATEGELRFKPVFYLLWRWLIRFVIPVVLVLVLMGEVLI